MTPRAESFFTPGSLEELLAFLKAREGEAEAPVFVAGGTDWTVRCRKGGLPPAPLIDLSGVGELRGIFLRLDEIFIGAAETMTSAAESQEIQCRAACLAQAAAGVGSWQIRNRATLGGNLANASPAADTPAALAALDASVTLISASGSREMPVRDVPAGPNASALKPGELITGFRIPLKRGRISAFGKTGSRSQVTVARLNLAVSAVSDGKKLKDARVFAGTLGSAARRCPSAEKILSAAEISSLKNPSVSDFSPDESGTAASFCEALAMFAAEAIPGRSTLRYKQSAIRALGMDVLAALAEAAGKEMPE